MFAVHHSIVKSPRHFNQILRLLDILDTWPHTFVAITLRLGLKPWLSSDLICLLRQPEAPSSLIQSGVEGCLCREGILELHFGSYGRVRPKGKRKGWPPEQENPV